MLQQAYCSEKHHNFTDAYNEAREHILSGKSYTIFKENSKCLKMF